MADNHVGRRWRTAMVIVGSLAAAGLLTPNPATAATVPFVDRPLVRIAPRDVVQTVPVIRAPPCRPADLVVEVFQAQGAGGHDNQSLRFTNTAEQPCSLTGRPRVTALIDGVAVAESYGGRTFPPDPPPPRDLPRGESAILAVSSSRNCNAANIPGVHPPPADAVVFHTDGGDITVPLRVGVACDFGVTIFGSTRSPGVSWPDTARLNSSISTMPARAEPGERLQLVVTVTNPTPGPVRLDPCPGYRVEFIAVGGAELGMLERVLNCETIRMFEVGQSVRYEIRVMVPAEAAGKVTVNWLLVGQSTPVGRYLLVG